MEASGTICKHIDIYYSGTIGTPALFCFIDSDFLKAQKGFEDCDIPLTDGGNGDKCHRDIINVLEKHAKSYAKNNFKVPDIYKCVDGTASIVTQDELEKFKEDYNP